AFFDAKWLVLALRLPHGVCMKFRRLAHIHSRIAQFPGLGIGKNRPVSRQPCRVPRREAEFVVIQAPFGPKSASLRNHDLPQGSMLLAHGLQVSFRTTALHKAEYIALQQQKKSERERAKALKGSGLEMRPWLTPRQRLPIATCHTVKGSP